MALQFKTNVTIQGQLTLGLNSTGQINFVNNSNLNTISIKSGAPKASVVYTLPSTGPTLGTSFLLSDTTGNMSWSSTSTAPTFAGIKLSGTGPFSVNINSVSTNALEDITSDASTFQSLLESHTNSSAVAPTISAIRSEGTGASPTICAINDAIGFHNFYGYSGSSSVGYLLASQVQYWICADGTTVSTTSMPGRIQFFTTPDLSITPSERMRINCTGTIQLFGPLQMTGNTIFGNTSSSGSLTIAANTASFVDSNAGRITFTERITFNQSFTPTANLQDAFITMGGTVTSAQIINIFPGFLYNTVYNVSVAQLLSGAPAFRAVPKFVHTVANLSDAVTYYEGFDSVPQFDTTAASGTSTSGFIYGYNARPQIFKTGAAALVIPLIVGFATYGSPLIGVTDIVSGATVTNLVCARFITPLASGANVTNYTGIQYLTPSGANKPTISNEFAYTSDMVASSVSWNLYFSGTAKSFMQGGLRIGDASPTQATALLDLVGKFTADTAGTITKYNNFTTAGVGMPSILAIADTSQSAVISATTILTPSATGYFRFSVYLQITTKATTSSILGGSTGVVLTYTDGDGSVAQTITMGLNSDTGTIVTTSATNTTATNLNGSAVIYAKTGVAIQYAVGYTSVGVTAMVYSIHARLEAL